MTSKPSSDRLREMRERAAALKKRPVEEPAVATESTESVAQTEPAREVPLEAHFGIAVLDQIAGGRTVQRIPVAQIAPETRQGQRQPRLLPFPDELIVNGQLATAYANLATSLLDLGRSLQERQIQPIIVYPGTSDAYPAARYLILVGHRRWTAAQLVGLHELDSIVVEAPAAVDRVRLQYAENEDRADFTDMERAWALQQMKQALGDAPWETVEERFQMSRTRRQELTRLLAFTNEQQIQLARLRLRETQIRPLHQALRDDELSPERVDSLLGRLGMLATLMVNAEGPALQPAVDGPTIARLVAKAKREEGTGVTSGTAQWAQALLDQFARTRRSIKSARRRVAVANDTEAAQIKAAIKDLATLLNEIEGELPEQE